MIRIATISSIIGVCLAWSPVSSRPFLKSGRKSMIQERPLVGRTWRSSSIRGGSSFPHSMSTAPVDASDTPTILPDFQSEQDYLDYMKTSGVCRLPSGFATGTAQGTFVSPEAPALGDLPIRATIIHLTEGPTDNWAAVFTKNKFPGAPVKVGRNRLAGGGPLHALVINNKVSNVCSGGDGVADSERVCEAVAKALNLPGGASTVLPSSTGVIGWRLPAEALAEKVVPLAAQQLQTVSALDAATAICTTDRFPKVRSKTLSNGARIVGIAKGAGMIEPNMATMLSYIMTDATIPKSKLQTMLSDVVDKSFNSISVDGAESTSDTVVLIASNQVATDDSLDDEFRLALQEVSQGLASDIVRNGEGTGHVMRVEIRNFPLSEPKVARQLGRFIVNSPLFKCAVAGNDPNTGRLAAAIGSFLGRLSVLSEQGGIGSNIPVDTSEMTITLGGRTIFQKGQFVLEGDAVEKALSQHMEDAQFDDDCHFPPHQKYVEIGIDFKGAAQDASQDTEPVVVLGSDLTAEYVAINADYRS